MAGTVFRLEKVYSLVRSYGRNNVARHGRAPVGNELHHEVLGATALAYTVSSSCLARILLVLWHFSSRVNCWKLKPSMNTIALQNAT